MKPVYSIIVPVYNEGGDVIPLFYNAITPVMESLKEEYEIIMINDGSKDDSLDIIKSFAEKDPRIKYISFSRNFGQ